MDKPLARDALFPQGKASRRHMRFRDGGFGSVGLPPAQAPAFSIRKGTVYALRAFWVLCILSLCLIITLPLVYL